MADNAVVKFDPKTFLVLGPEAEEAKEAMELAFKGTIKDKKLQRIRVPTGGGKSWTLPSLEETPVMVPSFIGVIIYARGARAWWQESYEDTGGGIRPDCYSSDDDPDTDMIFGKTWIDEATGEKRGPGMKCSKCPKFKWGSARKGGKGKDCKERNRLYVVRLDSALPDLLSLPTTSLENFETYNIALGGQSKRYYSVVTRFSLAQDYGGPSGKIEYSKAVFNSAAVLPKEDALFFRNMGLSLKAKLQEGDAYEDIEDEGEDVIAA